MTRARLFAAARIAVTAALLVWAFHRVDARGLAAALRGAHAGWLAGAAAAGLAGSLISTARWSVLLHAQGIRLPFARLLRLFLAGVFFSMFLPSAMGGDAARMALLAPSLRRREVAVSSVLADRMVGLAAMVVMALAAAAFTPSLRRSPQVMGSVALVAAAFAAGLALLGSRGAAARLARLLPRRAARLMESPARRVYGSLVSFARAPRALTAAFLLAFALQVSACAAVACAGLAFGVPVPVLAYFALVPVVSACTALPISVNGWGVQDSLFVALFGVAGASASQAALLSLFQHALRNAVGLLGGLAFLLGRPGRPEPGDAGAAIPAIEEAVEGGAR
ncbi:MAG: flippase-like domain-containing protein [Chthonomonadales bacterium]|nr:flippase-like domain-containing protein [Chthonomonadales bacterium]